jgi:hypothetical protein
VLSEWPATLIVRESACPTAQDRRTLDEELCADVAGLEGQGDERLTAAAKAIAYRLDPQESRAPLRGTRLPGPVRIGISEIEYRIGAHIAKPAA